MKTTKPISILVIGMEPTPALQQLAIDGHLVQVYDSPTVLALDTYDVIVGPKCWRYLPDVSDKFIDRIVKEARAAQPPKPKKVKVKRGAAAS